MEEKDCIRAVLVLHENVVSDDEVTILEDEYYYKNHNKAKVKLVINHYQNEWTDYQEIHYFKTLEKALDFYKNKCRERVLDQGKYWYQDFMENGEGTEEDWENEWDNLTYYCEI